MFRIQIFHSGCYLNTNHKSEDLDILKSLLKKAAFAGQRYQIVDVDGTVHFGPVALERNVPMSVEDLAEALGVPVLSRRDLGLDEEAHSDMTDTIGVGYTLEAFHDRGDEPIVSLRLEEAQALEIMRELWPDEDFWCAPGGSSAGIKTVAEAETINRILGNCRIRFQPERHQWHFHVYLT